MTERGDQGNGTQPFVEIIGRVATVRAAGEIDIATAPALGRALDEALGLLRTSRADHVVTDCSEVTFCDSPNHADDGQGSVPAPVHIRS